MSESEYVEWATRTSKNLILFANSSVIPFGILFNIIQIVIFSRKKLISTNMAFYFILIALFDIFILILGLIYFLSFITNIKQAIIISSSLGCKLFSFLFRFLFQASSWLNLFVTLDRLILIAFKNRFPILKNKNLHYIFVFVFFILLTGINSTNFLFEIEIQANNGTNKTELSKFCVAPSLVTIIRDVTSQALRIYIPFVLMILMNILLVIKVLKSKRKFKKDKNRNKEINLAFSVIGINICFLITLIPTTVWVILTQINKESTKPSTLAFLNLFEIIVGCVALYNYSFGLVIHLIFNSVFRNEFKLFFKFKCLTKKEPFSLSFQNKINDSRISIK